MGKTFWCTSWQEICCHVIENAIKITLTPLAQYKRHVIQAFFIHNLSFCIPLVFSNKTERKQIETLKGPRCWILLLDYSNQGGWGMSVSLKGCKFEHTELWIHLESFNDECAIVKETQDANLLSQESKLTRVHLNLNWCPSKSTIPVLKRIIFQYLKVN